MNWNLILTIISVVLAIAVPALVYYLQRIIRYRGKLSVALIRFDRVLGENPHHYSNLSLKYGEYQIENNLQYVCLLLFNERSYDITHNQQITGFELEKPKARVGVAMPKGVKWVDIRILRQSDQVGADVAIDSGNKSKAIVGFDMLRKGESVLLDGLIETENDYNINSLFDKMTFSHRIPQVDVIEKVHLSQEGASCNRRSRTRKHLMRSLFCFAFLAAALVTIDNIPLRFIDQDNGKTVYFTSNDKGEIIAHYKTPFKRVVYKVDDPSVFSTRMIPVTTPYRGFAFYFSIIASVIFILVFLYIEWKAARDDRRWIRLIKIFDD